MLPSSSVYPHSQVGHALRDMSVARHQLLARRKLRAQQRQQQQHPNNLQEQVVPPPRRAARVGSLASSSQEMQPYPSVATSSTTMLMTGRPTPGVPAAVLTVLPSSTTTIYDVDDVNKVENGNVDTDMQNLSPAKIFDDRFEPLPVKPSADGMEGTAIDDVDEDVATAAAFFPPNNTKQQQHAAATFAYTDLQLQREIVLTNRMLIMGAAHFEHQQQQAAAHYAQQQQQQAAAHYEQEQATVPRPDEVRTVPPTSPSRLVPGTSDGEEKVTRRVSFTEEQLDRQEDAAAREEPHPHPPPPRVSPFGVLRARHYQQLQSQYEELQRKQHWVVQQQRWKKQHKWGHNPRPQSNSQQQPPPPLPSVSQPVAPARYEIDTVVAV